MPCPRGLVSGRESQRGQECEWGEEEDKWSAFYECPQVTQGSSLPPRLPSHPSPSSHSCLVCAWSCCCLVTRSCLALLQPHGLQSTRLLCLWDFPGKNTGVGCHFLLQGIFLTQGSNLCLLHWQVGSFPLNHQGSPWCSPKEKKNSLNKCLRCG